MSYLHLGDADLTYVSDMAPVVEPDVVPGRLLGNGTGTIRGPHLEGILRWSFFEEDCAWDPGMVGEHRRSRADQGRSVCRTYPRGVIETEEGATLQFEARGFALRRRDDPEWTLASTVRFVTDHDAYQWLTDGLVVYEGTFDERTGTASRSFHAPEHMMPQR